MRCAKGREVDADGCSWHEHCPGPGEGAGPDPVVLLSGGEGMIARPAQRSHCLGLTKESCQSSLGPCVCIAHDVPQPCPREVVGEESRTDRHTPQQGVLMKK